MDALRHLRGRLLLPAVVAATSGAFAGSALAGDAPLTAFERGSLDNGRIAYNSDRYPVYQKVHREQEREKAEFARFEEKTDADRGGPETDNRARGHHRRAPYDMYRRD